MTMATSETVPAGRDMLRLRLTRDSVAAGDDLHAPHTMRLEIEKRATALDVVAAVLQHGYLPKISGGKATWAASSREPFALYAQEWTSAKSIGTPKGIDWLASDGGELRLHFSYIAQVDPNVALDVLSRCTFDAASVG